MGFNIDSMTSSHHLCHGEGFPLPIMGVGPFTARGTSYIEGPSVFGADKIWPFPTATVMIGPDKNIDTPFPIMPGLLPVCGLWNHSPYSLHVVGDVAINDYLDVNRDISSGGVIRGLTIVAEGGVLSKCGIKPFNIKHPDPEKEDWRLVHNCLEGPEIGVYYRGRVKNTTEINLPDYWKHLVHENSITVNLTSVGSHQDVIVKAIKDNKVILQSKGGMPIDCYYHIFAERKDVKKLVVEYEGTLEEFVDDLNKEVIK